MYNHFDRTVEYTYDSLYRLTSETITEGEKVTVYTYAYDNVSNRILKTENGSATEYVYNALNQLVSDSETSYEYDLNGNLVRVIGSAQSALYEYNAENKLVRATVQNGSLVIEESYTYDYQGNRTSKTTRTSDGNTEFVKYLNDTNSDLTNVLCELDENGTVKCAYTLGADLICQERDGKTYTYLYDGHGSVVGLANESGVVTDSYVYDAFGNLIDSTGTTANNYRYCGEQFDETTGLYYLRARYMDTATGRFIIQDTYQGTINDPVSLHKYLYCSSNPVMNIDPSGYMTDSLVGQMTCVLGVGIIASTLLTPNFSAVLSDLVMGLTNVVESLYCAIFTAPLQLMNYIANGVKNSLDIAQEILYSLTDDISTAKEIKVSEHDKNDTGPYIYTVYFLTDDTGQVAYVGRTKNLVSRMKQHERTDRKKLHLAFYISGLSYGASRGIEQFCMMIFHTLYRTALVYDGNGNLQSKDIGNRRNGVGSNNSNAMTYLNLGANSMRYVINQFDNAIKSLYD